MDKKAFVELVSSVQDMGCRMRGEKVAGARVTVISLVAVCNQADLLI
jgi:hypothetical protein